MEEDEGENDDEDDQMRVEYECLHLASGREKFVRVDNFRREQGFVLGTFVVVLIEERICF